MVAGDFNTRDWYCKRRNTKIGAEGADVISTDNRKRAFHLQFKWLSLGREIDSVIFSTIVKKPQSGAF